MSTRTASSRPTSSSCSNNAAISSGVILLSCRGPLSLIVARGPSIARTGVVPASGSRAFMSERMVLIEPGLGEDLLIEAQEKPHLDGIAAFDGQIELRAPMAGDFVRHRLGENIRERAARGPQYRLRLVPKRQIDQWPAQKFDHEFAHALRAWLAGLSAIAEARCDAARQRRRKRLIGEPVEPERQIELRASARPLLRHPHRDDVVVDLIVGQDFDELHGALAPAAFRLDPEARAAVIEDAVLVMIEIAVALQETEAARIVVGERRR